MGPKYETRPCRRNVPCPGKQIVQETKRNVSCPARQKAQGARYKTRLCRKNVSCPGRQMAQGARYETRPFRIYIPCPGRQMVKGHAEVNVLCPVKQMVQKPIMSQDHADDMYHVQAGKCPMHV